MFKISQLFIKEKNMIDELETQIETLEKDEVLNGVKNFILNFNSFKESINELNRKLSSIN